MKLVNFCFSDCNIFVWEIKGEFLSSVSSTTALSCSDLLSLPEKLQHPRVLSAKRNVTPSLVMTMKMTNRVYGYYVENKSTHSLRIHSLEKNILLRSTPSPPPLNTGFSLWMRKLNFITQILKPSQRWLTLIRGAVKWLMV